MTSYSGLMNFVVNSNKNVVPELHNYPTEVIQSTYFSFQGIIWYPIPYLKIISKIRGNAVEEKDGDCMDTEVICLQGGRKGRC